MIDYCILCGGGLVRVVGKYSWVSTKYNKIMHIDDVEYWLCEDCGEIILPLETAQAMDEEEYNREAIREAIVKISEALAHAKEVAKTIKCDDCIRENTQMMLWLQELINYKKGELKC